MAPTAPHSAPTHLPAMTRLAAVLRALGKLSQAKALYERVLAVAPQDAYALTGCKSFRSMGGICTIKCARADVFFRERKALRRLGERSENNQKERNARNKHPFTWTDSAHRVK